MADAWFEKLQSAQKTCLLQDGKRKIHFTFPDGTELAEDYDARNGELLLRKWRRKGTIGGVGKWEVEVGEQQIAVNLEAEGMIESTANPKFVRKDTSSHFQWRIRNLPYPISNYKVTVKPEDRQIIVSTVNKKYYKKFGVADMDRCGFPLEEGAIELAHANNTLIISYKKPAAILDFERRFLQEMKKMKAAKDGDVDCTPS